MLNSHRHLNKSIDGNCIVYKHTRNSEYVTIGNTNLMIKKLIDYGGMSKIFTTSNDKIIVKMTYMIDDEIKALERLTRFVINNETIHFIILYGYSKCNQMKLDKTHLSRSFTKKEISYVKSAIDNFYHEFYLLFLERFDDNLINVLYNEKSHTQILSDKTKSIYAQVILAIASFHYFLNAVHDDVSLKNFFIKYSNDYKAGQFIHYKLYDEDIFIPYFGFIVVIADYGNVKFDKFDAHDLVKDYEIILSDNKCKQLFNIDVDMISQNKSEKDLLLFLKSNILKYPIDQIKEIINKTPYEIYSSNK